jgi:hypothetical protein
MSTASMGNRVGAEREEQHDERRAHDEAEDFRQAPVHVASLKSLCSAGSPPSSTLKKGPRAIWILRSRASCSICFTAEGAGRRDLEQGGAAIAAQVELRDLGVGAQRLVQGFGRRRCIRLRRNRFCSVTGEATEPQCAGRALSRSAYSTSGLMMRGVEDRPTVGRAHDGIGGPRDELSSCRSSRGCWRPRRDSAARGRNQRSLLTPVVALESAASPSASTHAFPRGSEYFAWGA